jgi:hypothetical protein
MLVVTVVIVGTRPHAAIMLEFDSQYRGLGEGALFSPKQEKKKKTKEWMLSDSYNVVISSVLKKRSSFNQDHNGLQNMSDTTVQTECLCSHEAWNR